MPPKREDKPLSPEEQFAKPETITINGVPVPIYDIAPGRERLKTEVPTIIGLGWSATTEVYKKNMLKFADCGRRVISADAPHGIPADPIPKYPMAELRKAAAILETIDEKGIDKVDAVVHSEAGVFITIAATMRPEKFRNIVYIDPAGMIGKDNLPRLAVGFSLDLIHQTIREMKKSRLRKEQNTRAVGETAANPLGAVKVLAEQPGQSIRSVFAITTEDIREMLRGLKAKGVGLSVIHGAEDRAFPMKRMQEAMSPEEIDGFYSTVGTHNSFILEPEPYTRLADQALDALEKRAKGGKS